MIHELFCVGHFRMHPEATGFVMLRPASRAISPEVDVSLCATDMMNTVGRVSRGDTPQVSSSEVPFRGIYLVDGYLECYSDRLDDEARDFLEVILREKRCMVIDCLGRVTSLDEYVAS